MKLSEMFTLHCRVQVYELWAKGERVTCGMITEDTRVYII